MLAAGCESGDGSSLDERGRAVAHPYAKGIGSKVGVLDFEPTFGDIQDVFFEGLCTGCHAGPSAPRGLDLSGPHAWTRLVDRPAVSRPSMNLVSPGDPDNSYLIVKLEGGSGMSGQRMPRGRPARKPIEIDTIRAWIADGAPGQSAPQ